MHNFVTVWKSVAACGRGWSQVGRRQLGLVTRNWERRRFYRHVSVFKSEDTNGLFGVKLDHRNLRTPLRQLFLLPCEPLAMIVAQEWVGQEGVVKPSLMHVTSMCNTVLDNPLQRNREQAAQSLVAYLQSDTLLSRVSEPDDLVAMQQEEWDPVIHWFNKRFGVRVETYTSLLPPTVPLGMLGPVIKFMRELNRWSFAGFDACVESCKSIVLTCALFEGRLSPEEVTKLARLETRFQTGRWGEVEWQHGLEDSDLRARLSAGLIMHTLSYV